MYLTLKKASFIRIEAEHSWKIKLKQNTNRIPAALSNLPFGLTENPGAVLWFLFTATSLQKDNENETQVRKTSTNILNP